jgi:hypothetical protein
MTRRAGGRNDHMHCPDNSVSRSVIPFLDICGRRVERHGKGDRDAPITLPARPANHRMLPFRPGCVHVRILPNPPRSRPSPPRLDRRWLAGARPVFPPTGFFLPGMLAGQITLVASPTPNTALPVRQRDAHRLPTDRPKSWIAVAPALGHEVKRK